TDPAGQACGLGDHIFRDGDVFIAAGVMLTDPEVVKAKLFRQHDPLNVAIVRQRPVFMRRMFRHGKKTKSHNALLPDCVELSLRRHWHSGSSTTRPSWAASRRS